MDIEEISDKMLSSIEAKDISPLCETICYMGRKIMEELNDIPSNPTVIQCDNKSTILITKNPMFHETVKHIELWYHLLRDRVISGVVKVKLW